MATSAFVKVINNNIYCTYDGDIKDYDKTYWHFNNYNIILQNCLGFDIHNYVNKDLVVADHLLKEEENNKWHNTYMLKNVAFNVKDKKELINGATYYTSDSVIIHNNVKITKNNVIFYFYKHILCKKPSRLIIPVDIANTVDAITLLMHKKDMVQLVFDRYQICYKDIFFNFKDIDELNFADIEFCKKRITRGLDDYFSILLERI